MNSFIKTSATILLSISLASCSLFSPGSTDVVIETSEPNACIRVNGKPIGQGTASHSLKKNKNYTIVANCTDNKGNRKKGVTIIDSSMSTTGVLDIIGGALFLFPFLGFISNGAWTLDRDYVYVELI